MSDTPHSSGNAVTESQNRHIHPAENAPDVHFAYSFG